MLVWPAVSNQDEADTALGRPPEARSSLAHHYQRAAAAVATNTDVADAEAGSEASVDVESAQAQTSAQVAALTDDAMDFSWVNDMPDDAHPEFTPPTPWELEADEPDWSPAR